MQGLQLANLFQQARHIKSFKYLANYHYLFRYNIYIITCVIIIYRIVILFFHYLSVGKLYVFFANKYFTFHIKRKGVFKSLRLLT